MKKRIILFVIIGLFIVTVAVAFSVKGYDYRHNGCIMYTVAADKDFYIEARSFGLDEREFSGQHKKDI